MSSQLGIRRQIKRLVSSKALSIGLIVTLPILLAVAVAAVRIGNHQQPPPIVGASTVESRHSFYRFNIGERLIYAVSYANTSTSDFQKVFAEKQPSGKKQKSTPSTLAHSFSTNVQGLLTATVLDSNRDTVLIAYSLRNAAVNISTNGLTATAEAEIVKNDLSRHVFAQLDPQGRVLSVRFDPSVNSISKGFARALLSATQFVFPDEAKSSELSRWEVHEDDTAGRYIARYEMQPARDNPKAKDSPSVKMFRKTRARYVEPTARTGGRGFAVSTAINPGGNLSASFDFIEGRLVRLSGEESQAVLMAGKTVAQAETTISLNYAAKESLSAAELSQLRCANIEMEKVAESVPLSEKVSEDESDASIQRTELGAATIESLLSDLASLEASTDENRKETDLYLKFKALVYLHPDTSAALGKILTASLPGSASSRVLTGALSAVGNADAQVALAAAIQAHNEDWTALSMLIPALASVRSPSQLAEDTLMRLASDSRDWNIATTSQLALGVMAGTLAEQQPERAARLVGWAIGNLESSPSVESARQWLLVLGNTGSPEALPIVSRYVNDGSTELRVVAVSALRFIKSSQAEQLLIEALASDLEAVRLSAAVALGFREMSAVSFEAQKRALMKDKAVRVQLEVLKNLWQAREAFAEVHRLVRQAAAKDSSSEVRKAASEVLSK